MKKIFKFLLITICVLLFIIYLLKSYTKEQEDVAGLIGKHISGGELSMNDSYALEQIIDTYKNYLIEKDYEIAYKMLNRNYKSYISLEEFISKIESKDISSIKITNVERISSTTYHVLTNTSGEEDFTIIINSEYETFSLFPESFLKYKQLNNKNSKKKMECKLIDYLVKIDSCTLNFEITNKSKEDMIINSATLYTRLGNKIEKDDRISIPAKTSKNISISFDTDYDFPGEIVLNRLNGTKEDIEYSFTINK